MTNQSHYPPCSTKIYKEFDFWLGKWDVFDVETGKLEAQDHISKVHNGCGLKQDWKQLTTRYMTPGSSQKFKGSSVSFISNGVWKQDWVDNQGNHFSLKGKFDGDKMTLEGIMTGERWSIPYRIVWKKNEDGTISNWGEQRPAAATLDGKPHKFAEVPLDTWTPSFNSLSINHNKLTYQI